MSFGAYIHIPYCIQRCSYCDFATYVQNEILPPQTYVELVLNEIRQHRFFAPQKLDTIYFGGGTPSLIPAPLIIALIQGLEQNGYSRGPGTEITLEINPATVDEKKLELYIENGINRFSVGAQTFDDRLLKMVKREHNAEQTKQTLKLLNKYHLNYSFDILFALPSQTKEGLVRDLEIAVDLQAQHISSYCLTVPAAHPLSKGRPPEDEQVEMFDLIHQKLNDYGYSQYEISNFARPGFESRHNLLYWTDQEYWGLGLSSHSYSKKSPWGSRFWNPSTIGAYENQIRSGIQKTWDLPELALSESQYETLKEHQALTDFCHTSLRMMRGLSQTALRAKFDPPIAQLVEELLLSLEKRSLLVFDNEHWSLTQRGLVLSNLIYSELTFLMEDLPLTI